MTFCKFYVIITFILILQSCEDNGEVSKKLKVTTLAGSTGGYADGQGKAAQFKFPSGVAVDVNGNVYVADHGNNRIRRITPDGTATTFAGTTKGYADGPLSTAQFDTPTRIVVDGNDNVYVSDYGNDRIRKIAPDGTVSTLANIFEPSHITVDALGNVYVTALNNFAIRKITPSGGVSVYAGSTQGFADGSGSSVRFDRPGDIDFDALGNLYVADRDNNKIRKITPDGAVTTLAGWEMGYVDGGVAQSRFDAPSTLVVDADGNIFISESSRPRIRLISVDGTVSTIAGGGDSGFADGTGSQVKFRPIGDMAVDNLGNVYIADELNHCIRKGNLQ